MLCFMIFFHVWFLQTFLICCDENATVIRFSVPEDHHICLQCGYSDRSRVVWTHQDRRVLVTKQGNHETNEDSQRYLLRSDGGLCLLRLDDADDGEYRCNQLLVAELQVLTGHDFPVSAGRTLLLPCSRSPKHKQRWFLRRRGGRREAIFTRFRNGTVRPEADGSRLSFANDALQIQDLQPEDAGEYQCNGELQGRVTVLTVRPEPTSTRASAATPPSSAVMKTDVVETKKKKKKKEEEETGPEHAVLLVAGAGAGAGLGLVVLLAAAACVSLAGVRCRRKRRSHGYAAAAQTHEDSELQLWKTSHGPAESEASEGRPPPEEAIHYASLGRQNWRERAGRTAPGQDQHHVIYSSVITRPAAR